MQDHFPASLHPVVKAMSRQRGRRVGVPVLLGCCSAQGHWDLVLLLFRRPRRLLAALSPCRCSHSAGCLHPSSPAQVAAPGAVRLLMSRSSEARAPEQSSSKQDPTVTEKTADLQNAALPPPKKAPLIRLFSCCLYMVTADESRQVQPWKSHSSTCAHPNPGILIIQAA